MACDTPNLQTNTTGDGNEKSLGSGMDRSVESGKKKHLKSERDAGDHEKAGVTVTGASSGNETQATSVGRPVKKCPRHAARNYRIQREELLRRGYLLGEYLGEGSSAIVRSATVLPEKLQDENVAKVSAKNGNTNKVSQHSSTTFIRTVVPRLFATIGSRQILTDNGGLRIIRRRGESGVDCTMISCRE